MRLKLKLEPFLSSWILQKLRHGKIKIEMNSPNLKCQIIKHSDNTYFRPSQLSKSLLKKVVSDIHVF